MLPQVRLVSAVITKADDNETLADNLVEQQYLFKKMGKYFPFLLVLLARNRLL